MKKILAAVEFSDLTGRVVDQSSALARVFGAELVVVHVAPPEPEFVGYDAGPQSVRDAAARHYREESRQLQEIDRRIEALITIVAPQQKDFLVENIDMAMSDQVAGWELGEDGTYTRVVEDAEGTRLHDLQATYIRRQPKRRAKRK